MSRYRTNSTLDGGWSCTAFLCALTYTTLRYVKLEDLLDMGFPTIAHRWFADFTPNWQHMWNKGATCFWEGRAYDFRWIDEGSVRWFRFKTKRTMLKGAMSVHVCFDRPERQWRIRSACCNDCQAGKYTGFCHHIVVGLEGLVSILAGLILAGT